MNSLFEIVILVMLVIVILSFRSIVLKVILVAVIFPLISLFLYKEGLPLLGIISANNNLFSEDAIYLAYYSYLVGVIGFILVLYPLKNRRFEYEIFEIKNNTHLILFVLFLISSYGVFQIRSESGGSATFYLVFSSYLLFCTKGFRNIFTILHLFFLIFIIAQGERVDSLLAIVFILIMDIERNKRLIVESYKKKYLYISFIGLFVFALFAAFIRTSDNFDFSHILTSIYAQQTISDVLYVYLSGTEYYTNNGVTPSLLNNLIFGTIPGEYYGIESSYYYGRFLINNFAINPGGGLFFTEGMMAFGPIGVVIYLMGLAYIFKKLFTRKNILSNLLFILLFTMTCRIVWYGLIYAYKPVLIVMFLYLLVYLNNPNLRKLKSA